MEKTILEYYKKYNYPSANVLYKILVKDQINVTLKQVKEVIQKQSTHQIHKKVVKPKNVSHIVAFKFNEIILADLIDLSSYSTTNKNFKWLLVIEDVFTRKAFGYALKNKTASTVLDAFKMYIKKYGFPHELITDNGSEFISNMFKEYVQGNLFHKLVEKDYHNTLGIIDRLCRTLKEKLFRYFYAENTTIWYDKIQDIIDTYNNTPHKALDYISPDDVENYDQYVQKLNQDKVSEIKSLPHNFKVGQQVRYRLARPLFTKGYKRIWSSDIHTIKSLNGQNATLDNSKSYKLVNLQIVDSNSEVKQEHVIDEVAKVEKVAKQNRILNKEDIDKDNIIDDSTKRIRIKKIKLDL